jgi:hypothetical protein
VPTFIGKENIAAFLENFKSVHRTVMELTEARAALVRQRAGLLAVVELVLPILAPFIGAGMI